MFKRLTSQVADTFDGMLSQGLIELVQDGSDIHLSSGAFLEKMGVTTPWAAKGAPAEPDGESNSGSFQIRTGDNFPYERVNRRAVYSLGGLMVSKIHWERSEYR